MTLIKNIIFKLSTWLVVFICIPDCNSQSDSINLGISLNSGVSTQSTLPFWATANKYGVIPNSSYGALNAYLGHSFQDYQRDWDFEYKGSLTGNLAAENLIFINEFYGRVRFKGIILTVGNRYDDVKKGGLSSSNGDFVKSINAREMPGINLETNDFVPLFFWKKWFSIKANYAEYLMNDNRDVENTHVHHKSLHLKFKTSERFSFSVGLDDWAQWSGNSPKFGNQSYEFDDYIRMILGLSGDENSSTNDQINVLGNHIGSYLLEFNYLGEKLNWNFYWSHPFEDRSGRELMNWPDALYGLELDFRKPNALVSSLVTEVTYTKNASGSKGNTYTPGGELIPGSGEDRYFYNYLYRSGWTYFGKIIGSPYFTPREIDEKGITYGPNVSYNRFIAFNIGFKGVVKRIPYRMMLSHVTYFDWFTEEFETTPHQFSGLAEFNISPILKLPLDIEIGTSFDLGNKLPNNLGGYLKLSKEVHL